MSAAAETRSERVDLRMTPDAKRLLQQAAASSNKSLTEFLLDHGLEAAVEALAARRVFVLEDARWQEFMAALDRPPAENPGLKALLVRRPAWEA